MKQGWKYKKLGEVCEIFGRIGFRGYTKGDLVSSPEEGAITLSPSNIVNGEMDYRKCSYITWAKYEESPEIMIFPGDILLVKTASVGKTALVKSLPHKATINPQFVVLKKISVSNEYLSYYLKSDIAQAYIWSIAKGAAAQTVSQKNLAEMQVPVPPIDEQRSIVSRLDAAFAGIDVLKANAERQLAEARALFNRALTEEMTPKEGWEEKTLGEVCIKSKNIKWDTIDEDKSFIYIDLTSVDRTDLQIHNPQIVNKHNAPSRAKQIVKTGDVIFATTRPTLRRVSLIDEQFDSNICSTGFCVLRPGKDVVSEWIFYALQEVSFYYYIEPLQAGANYPAVTDSDVKNYAIPIPPITNQHSIVSRLDALSANVRKLEELQRKTLAECDALKQAMLKEVFE